MGKDIITEAKNIIRDYTPLNADCGLLCEKNCCKGDDSTGMLLFPHEETDFEIKEKDGVRLCICKGECDRESRPLSCMIFPFFPYLDKEGKIKAVPDLRGITVCPMIAHKEKIRFSKIFLRRVAHVGRLLKKDPECRKFLWETSREIDKIELFVG